MSSHVRTLTATRITRAWLDIEPKVYAGLAGGGIAAAVVIALRLAGVHLNTAELALIPWAAGQVAAYVKASTHKGELLPTVIASLPEVEARLAPTITAAIPAASPVLDAVEEIQAALTPAEPHLAAPTAS